MFSLLLSLFIVPAAPIDIKKEQFEQGIAANVQYRRQLFIKAGLAGIEEVAAQKRQVRRLHLTTWTPGSIPIVEIERLPTGSVTLSLVRPGVAVEQHPVASSVWQRLKALDPDVLPPSRYDPERLKAEVTWSSCHGDVISLEVSKRGKAYSVGGNQCVNSLEQYTIGLKAVLAIVSKAVIDTRPACAAAQEPDPTRALEACF